MMAKRNTKFRLKCKRLLQGSLFLVGMVLVMAMATSCGDRDSQESGQAREPGAGSESEGSLPGTDEEYSRESGTDSDEGEDAGDGPIAVADFSYMPMDAEDLRDSTNTGYYTIDGEWLYYAQYVNASGAEEVLASNNVYISRGRISDGWQERDYIVQPKTVAYIRLNALMADGAGNCYVYWTPGHLAEEEDRFYTLEKYGSEGELLWKADYREEDLSGMGDVLDQGTVTADGRVFLFSTGSEGGILSFGSDGGLGEAYALSGLESLDGVASGKDGKVYGYCLTGEDPAFVELGGSEGRYPCPDGILDVYDGRGSDPCVRKGDSLWSYEPETGELGRLWGWGDESVQIAGEDVDAVFRDGEDFMVMCSEFRSKWEDWVDKRPVQTFAAIALEDRERHPPRQRLALGTAADEFIRGELGRLDLLVRMYNRQSREYRVELVEEKDEDSMQMKFIQGKGADIIDLTHIYAGNLAGIGAFEDLTAYYEASDTVGMEDILDPVREACVLAGKNVLVMPSFHILTVSSLEKEVTAQGWDVWEYLERAENEWVFDGQNPLNALTDCMGVRAGEYFIDYEKKECHFDSPEFRKLLEACGRVRTYDEATSANSRAHSVFVPERITTPWDMTRQSIRGYELWDWADRLVGYPGMYGPEHKLYPSSVFAMNSASKNKEGAWDFLEFMMSEEVQLLTSWCFPSRKDAFEQSLSDIYVSPSRANSFPLTDENGQIVILGKVKEVTDHEKEVLRGIVEDAKYDSWGSGSSPLWRIVSEEAAMYFKGDAGLDSTIDKIQSRVQLYLDESKQ